MFELHYIGLLSNTTYFQGTSRQPMTMNLSVKANFNTSYPTPKHNLPKQLPNPNHPHTTLGK